MVEVPLRPHRLCAALLVAPTLMAGLLAAAQPPSIDAGHGLEPETLLERASAPYAQVRSYRHRSVFTSKVVDPDTPGSRYDDLGVPPDGTSATLAVVKPDRLYFDDGVTTCVTNGVVMWVVNRELGEYTEELLDPVREPHESYSWACPKLLRDHDHVLAELFPIDPDEGSCSPWGSQGCTLSARVEDLDGEPGVRIRWDEADSAAFSSLWIDQRTGLIGEHRSRQAYAMRVDPGGNAAEGEADQWVERVSKRVIMVRYHDVELDGEIPDDLFVFLPGIDDRLVETIGGQFLEEAPPLEPTLTLADGSLVEIAAERLIRNAGTRVTNFGTTTTTRRIDLDDSDHGELTVLIADQTLQIVSADGTTVRRVQLQASDFRGWVRDIVAVEINRETHWFAGLGGHSGSGRGQAMWGLFQADGEEVWRYVPELPPGQVAEAELAAGDLDGDAWPELVLAMRLSTAERNGEGWSSYPSSSLLVVLDVSGRRLVQRVFAGQLKLVRVLAPEITGARPQLLCLIGSARSLGTRLELLELGGAP